MRVSFAGSVAKTPDNPETNEDCFILNQDMQRIVLCDGASESFDSRTWAHSLAQLFSDDPAINPAWVERAVLAYNANHDVNTLSWSKQAAFERGSFATLLGVEINNAQECIELFAIGDSIAILIENACVVASWPYTTAEQFDERPSLLSTISHLNSFVSEDGFYLQRQISWNLKKFTDPILLCMTDAMGQWVLRMVQEQDDAWKALLSVATAEQLAEIVTSQRAAKKMRTDDSTLIVIRFNSSEC